MLDDKEQRPDLGIVSCSEWTARISKSSHRHFKT
jgi:hypothetical protein